jgi:hypothetical protein
MSPFKVSYPNNNIKVVSRELTLGNLLGRELLDVFGELYQQGTNQSTNANDSAQICGKRGG